MRDVLLYTVAFDAPGSRVQAAMARLLVQSLRHAGFDGPIHLFRNGAPVFPLPQWEVREHGIPTGSLTEMDLAECGCRCKYEAASKLTDAEKYRRIVYMDADILALRNPEALWNGEEDILWVGEPGSDLRGSPGQGCRTEEDRNGHPEREGANGGTWSVKGSRHKEIMGQMRRLLDPPGAAAVSGEQQAWNKILLDSHYSTRQMPPEVVGYPAAFSPHYGNYRNAALLHFLALEPAQKLSLMLGHWAAHRFRGKTALLADLLEF